jgi:hypothetical protein
LCTTFAGGDAGWRASASWAGPPGAPWPARAGGRARPWPGALADLGSRRGARSAAAPLPSRATMTSTLRAGLAPARARGQRIGRLRGLAPDPHQAVPAAQTTALAGDRAGP